MNSNFDTTASSSFNILHPDIQRWIWKQKWTTLREVQEMAIPPVLAGDRDVVISASTAAGKTEAVFFPLATRILGLNVGQTGFTALVISPLKALINDQYDRLKDLLGAVDIPVHRRHGDVSQVERLHAINRPGGVLLITPESLEALFMQRGHQIPTLFAPLQAMVVDELHAFIGRERGMQLQSLMHRLDVALRRRVPRLGLSATLGDMDMAVHALRPRGEYPCQKVASRKDGQYIRLKLLGFEDGPDDNAEVQIAQSLFHALRGESHLIFANARQRVESYANRLREMCERAHLPNEFWPHHGNLSKDVREDTENALKTSGRPATAICTSTLEMGIDIGRVVSIAQLGSPPSVSSLRQRLGRSGRRGQGPILRLYVQENTLVNKPSLTDQLRMNLFQATAMVTLMEQHWCEPPDAKRPHLSTLVQQILSLLTQWGEITPKEAFILLCEQGPFYSVKADVFKNLLRDLRDHGLIKQTANSALVLDEKGEILVNHYSFYATFHTPKTYRLVHKGKTLGELPVEYPLTENQALVFAGQRWLVVAIDTTNLVIQLTPSKGKTLPLFGGAPGFVHDTVRKLMKELYTGTVIPPFLNPNARTMFLQGRTNFLENNLAESCLIKNGKDIEIFPWRGDRVLITFATWLACFDISASCNWGTIQIVNKGVNDLQHQLASLMEQGPPDPMTLAGMVKEKKSEKFHHYISDQLLNWELAAGGVFDPEGAWQVAKEICENNDLESWLDTPNDLKSDSNLQNV
ncbi:MAG: DEAD/DEAH box helicase [Magnetococcales bacterium]|nr:DEAD/DEAH box helicase [Magnetococcales bacterium]